MLAGWDIFVSANSYCPSKSIDPNPLKAKMSIILLKD